MKEFRSGDIYQHDQSGVFMVIHDVKGDFLVVHPEGMPFSKSTVPTNIFKIEYTLVGGGNDER